MPQITVYIKKEDIPRWKAIKHKAEWIRSHLYGERYEEQEVHPTIVTGPVIKQTVIEPKVEPVKVEPVVIIDEPQIKNSLEGKALPKFKSVDLTTILAKKRIKTCTHGYAVGLCKFNCRRGV